MESVTLAGRRGTTAPLPALYLGFSEAPAEFGMTQDVDGIIRLSQLSAIMEDVAFLVRKISAIPAEMEVAYQQVRMPDLHEPRDAFERALPRVREILNRNGRPK